MSVVPATQLIIYQHRTFAADWRPCSGRGVLSGDQMIPPCDDALMIRFMFYMNTMFTFAPDGKILEHWMIPGSPTKAITVRPSEFSNHDATSNLQSPSGRMMIDFINTHFPPEDKVLLVPKVVATLVDLVQSSIGSETEGFIDVHRYESVEILLLLNDDEATRLCMQGYFEATKRGTCAICLDDYEIGRDDGIRLPCFHVFHGPCIYKWLVINPLCPVCRHTFKEPELAPWFDIPLQFGCRIPPLVKWTIEKFLKNFPFRCIPLLVQWIIEKFPKNFPFLRILLLIQWIIKKFPKNFLSEFRCLVTSGNVLEG